MTSPAPLLEIDGLRVSYRHGETKIAAIRAASLEVREGEAVGLVGESGSGKSSLARAALGLLPEHAAVVEAGRIVLAGREMTAATPPQWESVRGHPVAIVFQDPLSFLNPVMRVGVQIAESVRRHDPRADRSRRVAQLLDLVRLPQASARLYPHELSGGMRQRALIAIALGCRPRLLIADEPTTALDVTTQAEILALIADMRERLGMGLLLISHDLAVVASICTRIHVMYAGEIVEWGPTREVFGRPSHPYTGALLRAARMARTRERRFATIEGDAPSVSAPAAGCPFAPRCPHANARCRAEMPPAVAVGTADHQSRCWLKHDPEKDHAQPGYPR
jgi:oligopeptide/dipeptide ABC transporter ATP-binding protein